MTAPSFYRISESPPGEIEKCLVYAGAKIGKTALFGTLGSRTLMVNTGAGLETIKSPWFKQWCKGSDPLCVDIKEHITAKGEITEAIAYDATCDAIDYAIAKFGDEFDSVVVDDMTAFQTYAMNKSSEIALESGIVKTQMKKIEKASDKAEKLERIMVEVAEWQGQMNLTHKFLVGTIGMCELNKKDIYFGAHEKYVYKMPKNELTGKMIIGASPEIIKCYPAFTGKQYPDQVQAIFDDVWHLELVGKDADAIRRLRMRGGMTADFGQVMAGTRHDGVFLNTKGASVDYIDNPNLSEMLAKIRTIHSKGAK